IDDGSDDYDSRIPFVVSGNHVPRRPRSGRAANHVFVSQPEVVPMRAFPYVAGGKLPVFVRPLDSFEEALLLFLFRDVEKEFTDQDAVAAEIALVIADVLAALLPDVLTDNRRW